ncbi:MAG: hypothetical protein ABIR96_06185 [Bdellovibrionota bacterium]
MKLRIGLWLFWLCAFSSARADSQHSLQPSPVDRRIAKELHLRLAYQERLEELVDKCPTRVRNKCLQTKLMKAAAFRNPQDRHLSFENFTNFHAPGGVCWGYARYQRKLLAFARFGAPRASAPRTRAQARRLLLPISWGVPMTLPGVSSIASLSQHPVYAPEIRKLMTEMWSEEFFRPSNLAWALHMRSPAQNLQAIAELTTRTRRKELPILVLQFSVGSQHVVLLEKVTSREGGFEATAVDSNRPGLPQTFFFDTNGNYVAKKSANIYGALARLGLKVVDRDEAAQDSLGLSAECCLQAEAD